MRWLLLLMMLTAAVVVQTTLAGVLTVGRAKPDFILALAIFFALHFDLREVFIPIWTLGIFRDVFSLGPIGMYGLIFLVIAVIVGYVRAYAFRDNLLILIPTVVIAVVLCETAGHIALSVRYRGLSADGIFTGSLLIGLYTSLVLILLGRLLDLPCKWIGLGREY